MSMNQTNGNGMKPVRFSETMPPTGSKEYHARHATLVHREAAKHLEHALEHHREAVYHMERGNHKEAKAAYKSAKEHMEAARYSHGELKRHHEMFNARQTNPGGSKFEACQLPKGRLKSFGDLLPGGRADGDEPADFDTAALAEGTKHEMEHTKDEAKAREIAMDHLAEDKKYYEKLKKANLSAKLSSHADEFSDQPGGPPDRHPLHHETLLKHGYKYVGPKVVDHKVHGPLGSQRAKVLLHHRYEKGESVAQHYNGHTEISHGGSGVSSAGFHSHHDLDRYLSSAKRSNLSAKSSNDWKRYDQFDPRTGGAQRWTVYHTRSKSSQNPVTNHHWATSHGTYHISKEMHADRNNDGAHELHYQGRDGKRVHIGTGANLAHAKIMAHQHNEYLSKGAKANLSAKFSHEWTSSQQSDSRQDDPVVTHHWKAGHGSYSVTRGSGRDLSTHRGAGGHEVYYTKNGEAKKRFVGVGKDLDHAKRMAYSHHMSRKWER